MKAWKFTTIHDPLVLDMKAAGLWDPDVGLPEDEGWLALPATRPITSGHENTGVVAEINEKVWPLAEELGAKGVKKSIRTLTTSSSTSSWTTRAPAALSSR